MKRPWIKCNHLLYAIEGNDVETAEQVIDGGFDVDTILLEGKTAVCICIQRGKTELVKLLLSRSCSLSLRTPNGDYPLHLAVHKGDIALVRMLLDYRADVTVLDALRKTALHLACEFNLPDIAKLLIERCSLTTLNACDRDGRTALMHACNYGMRDVIACLLQRRCEVNTIDTCGETPLLLSINRKTRPSTVKLLLNAGADVNHGNYDGEYPLMRALVKTNVTDLNLRNHFHQLSLTLLDHGCNMRISNKLGQTPLHYAVSCNDPDLVQVVMNAGCELTVQDKMERNPLHYAFRNRNKKIIDVLYKGGAGIPLSKLYNWSIYIVPFCNTHLNELIDYVVAKSREMHSLKDLCRITIRKCFINKGIEKNAKFLPLPKPLSNYIVKLDT